MFSLTNILILINILVFIFGSVIFHNYNYFLIEFGLNQSNLSHFLIWFTNSFLHVNLMHISFNMLALYDIGNKVENLIGKFQFLILYFISIIGSSFASFIFLSHSINPMVVVGASGAIFGLFAYLYISLGKIKEFLIFFVIINSLFMIIPGMNIAWYAHLGGAIVGTIFSFIFKPRQINYF